MDWTTPEGIAELERRITAREAALGVVSYRRTIREHVAIEAGARALQEAAPALAAALTESRAEVERLRATLASVREGITSVEANVDAAMASAGTDMAEIVRLRIDNERLRSDVRLADEEVVRARSDADDLAGLLGRTRGYVEAFAEQAAGGEERMRAGAVLEASDAALTAYRSRRESKGEEGR